MDKQTIEKLKKKVNDTYLGIQEEFDTTRQFPWKGWQSIEKYVSGLVLDLGWGHGRFYAYIKDKGLVCEYIGIDNNNFLIEQAKKRYPKTTIPNKTILRPHPANCHPE